MELTSPDLTGASFARRPRSNSGNLFPALKRAHGGGEGGRPTKQRRGLFGGRGARKVRPAAHRGPPRLTYRMNRAITAEPFRAQLKTNRFLIKGLQQDNKGIQQGLKSALAKIKNQRTAASLAQRLGRRTSKKALPTRIRPAGRRGPRRIEHNDITGPGYAFF